jgi:hypothetical protein
MRHTRLYGYQCGNPEHAEIANQIFSDWLNYNNRGTLEQFIGSYPEHERAMIRRVIEPELPGWFVNNATED